MQPKKPYHSVSNDCTSGPNLRPSHPWVSVPAAADPLNPAALEQYRVKDEVPVESIKILAPPRICKPSNATWFRTHPDETEWHTYHMLSPADGMGNVFFVVTPSIALMLGSVAILMRLIPCITREGQVIFWPLKIPDRSNTWAESARIIAGEAMKEWRRIEANMTERRYDAWKPVKPVDDPVWPGCDGIGEMRVLALQGKMIDSASHPEVSKLLMA